MDKLDRLLRDVSKILAILEGDQPKTVIKEWHRPILIDNNDSTPIHDGRATGAVVYASSNAEVAPWLMEFDSLDLYLVMSDFTEESLWSIAAGSVASQHLRMMAVNLDPIDIEGTNLMVSVLRPVGIQVGVQTQSVVDALLLMDWIHPDFVAAVAISQDQVEAFTETVWKVVPDMPVCFPVVRSRDALAAIDKFVPESPVGYVEEEVDDGEDRAARATPDAMA
jgi:hypothetical protein